MRLWSVHPRYFDRQALLACWREACKPELRSPLVAQAGTDVRMPEPHPLFTVTEGPVASWERLKDSHGGVSH
ncbi:pyrimidine dimer DNA glycosylase/endonuclease V [Arthrobacter dokdonensis]|uniref:pyrimidine dimer DNA glycosylase/endonuclease V n=1 Tax=Arthrobacter dokdonellae TaxID=2211210 RepID=UPI000DE5AA5D